MPARLADKVTRVPLRVDPHFEETPLGVATGFFFRGPTGTFLVTNWHVVSGRHPKSLACLSPTGGLPDRLRLTMPYNVAQPPAMVFQWRWSDLRLYNDGKPVWLEHPVHRHAVDVVAIPLDGLLETSMLFAANDKAELDLDDIPLAPSLDVFVVGFPLGMYGGAKFPIWKRGSIASEPDIDVDGKPHFYIDTATREGMSAGGLAARGERGHRGNDVRSWSRACWRVRVANWREGRVQSTTRDGLENQRPIRYCNQRGAW
jgi:hypothetical protein